MGVVGPVVRPGHPVLHVVVGDGRASVVRRVPGDPHAASRRRRHRRRHRNRRRHGLRLARPDFDVKGNFGGLSVDIGRPVEVLRRRLGGVKRARDPPGCSIEGQPRRQQRTQLVGDGIGTVVGFRQHHSDPAALGEALIGNGSAEPYRRGENKRDFIVSIGVDFKRADLAFFPTPAISGIGQAGGKNQRVAANSQLVPVEGRWPTRGQRVNRENHRWYDEGGGLVSQPGEGVNVAADAQLGTGQQLALSTAQIEAGGIAGSFCR